jgi:hypothetical protein
MSTTPNDWLSNLYGTAPSEQEKLAAVQDSQDAELWEMFKAAAAEDGIDADELSDEQVQELSSHYINEAGAGPGAEAGDDSGELPPNWDGDDVEHFNGLESEQEKQAFVQFKEADLVGKIMAHSMFSEMDKLAGSKTDKLKAHGGAIGGGGAGALIGGRLGEAAGNVLNPRGMAHRGPSFTGVGRNVGRLVGGAGGALLGNKYDKKRGSKKEEASKEAAMIIEATAIERARNFLKEAGIDPDSGGEYDEYEGDFDLSEITEEDASDLADARAEEILKEAFNLGESASALKSRATDAFGAAAENLRTRAQQSANVNAKGTIRLRDRARAVGGVMKDNPGRTAAGAGGLALAGYGAKKLLSRKPKQQEKEAMTGDFDVRGMNFDDAGSMMPGRGAVLKGGAGLLAAGGAAYGAKKLHQRRKARSKEAAMIIEATAIERARTFLKEAGIDPDSGEEYQGEEDFDLSEITEDDASEIADERAEEILKEAGWLQ